MTLGGVVAGAVTRTVVTSQRLHRAQMERLSLRANLRTALWLIESELQELNAGDMSGSDLIEIEQTSFTYNAMRNMYFLCEAPDVAARELTLRATSFTGLRELDPSRDSVFVFGDTTWFHAGLDAAAGASCPDDSDGLLLELSGVSSAQLSSVEPGSPVRGVQPTQLRLYAGRSGDSWLGLSDWSEGRGWSRIQPVAGPFASDGLRFSYYDASDQVTTDPRNVVRIGVTLITAGKFNIRDSLVTEISLRNNPRW